MTTAFFDRKIWDRKILLFIFLSPIFLSKVRSIDLPTFLDHHCFDCHDGDKKKGGFDLSALQLSFSSPENFALWVKLHDRIESGEMPPKKKELSRALVGVEFRVG